MQVATIIFAIVGIAFAVYQYRERKRVELVVNEILQLEAILDRFSDKSLPEAQKMVRAIIAKLQSIRNLNTKRVDIEAKINSLVALLR